LVDERQSGAGAGEKAKRVTTTTARPAATGAILARLPFHVPLLAALPIALCMVVAALPYVGNSTAGAFRILYLGAFLAWLAPLTWFQRMLWRRGLSWKAMLPILLLATYLLSLLDSVLGQTLAIRLGTAPGYQWRAVFRGLDGCWLPMIGYCASHAVVASFAALGREQLRVAEAQAGARDAELRALRYQLQPHFLFNTLNAISSLVADKRNQDARRMIAQLGDFLRATLDAAHGHEHALADELALTQGYLEIEKARLGNRLAVRMKVDPGLLNAPVPFLILQPLVENAIRHGLALRDTRGALDLVITREAARLQISVANDLPAGAAELEPSGARIGIANVGTRLERLYGADHAFAAGRGADGRFQVSIALPLTQAAPPDRMAA